MEKGKDHGVQSLTWSCEAVGVGRACGPISQSGPHDLT